MLKNLTAAFTLAAVLLTTSSCGLIPKKVEFFQTDVPKYPSKTAQHTQAERQTAARLAEVARATETAAIAFDAPWDVVYPAQEASQLAGALSTSLGPPERAWKGTTDALATRLDALAGKQDTKLDRLEAKLDKVEGKPIEGTGKVQVPYLLWVAIVIGGIALLIALAHSGLSIAAMFNPVAAGIKGGLGFAEKGVVQLVKGGGNFIAGLEHSNLTQEARDEVKRLFVSSHKQAQDEDVKKAVSSLPGSVSL